MLLGQVKEQEVFGLDKECFLLAASLLGSIRFVHAACPTFMFRDDSSPRG